MDWDQHYLDEHTPWDKGEAAPPLLEWLSVHPGKIQGRVLVPGAGRGHDAAAIVAETEAREAVAIDISSTALKLAKELYCDDRLRFAREDLFDLPEDELGSYDWIWEHTCFCAIDPGLREDYVAAVHSALSPGGHLLAVFYLDPYDDEHQPGGGPPHGSSLEEIEKRFVSSGKFKILESYVPEKSYSGREELEQVVLLKQIPG
ncbi:MAG: methyltransferase domain-containing protein [Verrucomicrobiales bacterium]|nr:methyltransferase domain-containing protein [Verrucomicrobiales bacterium]